MANLNGAALFDVAGKSKDPEKDLSAAKRQRGVAVCCNAQRVVAAEREKAPDAGCERRCFRKQELQLAGADLGRRSKARNPSESLAAHYTSAQETCCWKTTGAAQNAETTSAITALLACHTRRR